ncbi:MAG: hypothetical protein QG608_2018 [Actinomycetota bacterium]|nr:hypothetical protein [Actinomycetota bacterium]
MDNRREHQPPGSARNAPQTTQSGSPGTAGSDRTGTVDRLPPGPFGALLRLRQGDDPRGPRWNKSTPGGAETNLIRRVTDPKGDSPIGLARVLELHLAATFADALVISALVTALIFDTDVLHSRGLLGTCLLVALVPFAVVTALLGPALDRLPQGRRWVMIGTLGLRALLVWILAAVLPGRDERAGAAAFGLAVAVLACQKGFHLTRAATIPRVMPVKVRLGTAFARVHRTGVVAVAVGAPLGAWIGAVAGQGWTLRLAALVYLASIVPAHRQSHKIDTAEGESPALMSSAAAMPGQSEEDVIPQRVLLALWAGAALRAFAGFQLVFLVLLLQVDSIGSLRGESVAILAVIAAGAGVLTGTCVHGATRKIRPEWIGVAAVLLAMVTSAWAAASYDLFPVLLMAFAGGLGHALSGILPAVLVERDMIRAVRVSALSKIEMLFQLFWLAGVGVALALPLSGSWEFGFAALVTGAMALLILGAITGMERDRRTVREPVPED